MKIQFITLTTSRRILNHLNQVKLLINDLSLWLSNREKQERLPGYVCFTLNDHSLSSILKWIDIFSFGYVLPNPLWILYSTLWVFSCFVCEGIFCLLLCIIFLFVTKTIASLYKVLALMHIFTPLMIPPIVFIRIVLQSTHMLKILWSAR